MGNGPRPPLRSACRRVTTGSYARRPWRPAMCRIKPRRARLLAGLTWVCGAFTAAAVGQGQEVPGRWRPAQIDPAAPFARELRLSADAGRLVVGWRTGVRLWDLATGRSVTLHDDAAEAVYGPRLFPDGRWVVGI